MLRSWKKNERGFQETYRAGSYLFWSMVDLNLDRINSHSPYVVTASEGSMSFQFVTDFGVTYNVSFLEDELMLSDESYQFIIANTNNKKSPRDSKMRQTIMAIVYEFLNVPIQPYYISVKQGTVNRECVIVFSKFGLILHCVSPILFLCLLIFEMLKEYRIMQRLLSALIILD